MLDDGGKNGDGFAGLGDGLCLEGERGGCDLCEESSNGRPREVVVGFWTVSPLLVITQNKNSRTRGFLPHVGFWCGRGTTSVEAQRRRRDDGGDDDNKALEGELDVALRPFAMSARQTGWQRWDGDQTVSRRGGGGGGVGWMGGWVWR